MKCCPLLLRRGLLGAIMLAVAPALFGQDASDLARQLEEVREQNRLLQSQLQQQQRMIDKLSQQFSTLQKTNQQQQNDYLALKSNMEGNEAPKKSPVSIGNVIISGEGGVGFFASQRGGQFPNDELRVDEARLFLEAPLLEDIYFYGQMDLRTRETGDDGVYLGELYRRRHR